MRPQLPKHSKGGLPKSSLFPCASERGGKANPPFWRRQPYNYGFFLKKKKEGNKKGRQKPRCLLRRRSFWRKCNRAKLENWRRVSKAFAKNAKFSPFDYGEKKRRRRGMPFPLPEIGLDFTSSQGEGNLRNSRPS